jgi:metal-dependent amidase/aminoacylase/carboxypeptidase family protein
MRPRRSSRRASAELVGNDNVERQPPLIMASEDFSYMLERVPGCYINIGNGGREGSCEVHNRCTTSTMPRCRWARRSSRLVETRLSTGPERTSTNI